MDDIFYFSTRPLQLADVARSASEAGWFRVVLSTGGLVMSYDEGRWSGCHWAVYGLDEAEPAEAEELVRAGLVDGFCISHHPPNPHLLELLKVIMMTNGGWVGNDSAGFHPRFDVSSIESFQYPET